MRKDKNTINSIINSDAKISHIINKKAINCNFKANLITDWYLFPVNINKNNKE